MNVDKCIFQSAVRRHQVSINGYLVYRIASNNNIIESGTIPNAFTSWGKNQIALLCGGLGGTPIEEIRVLRDSSWIDVSISNSESGGTLIVDGQTWIGGPGTVSLIRCAPASGTDYHNEISCTIVLESGWSLDVTVKIGFSGLEGYDGNRVTACRLGNCGSYNYPINTIVATEVGTGEIAIASTNSVSNNTLTVQNESAFTGPNTYTDFGAKVSSGQVYYKFSGSSVELASGQELWVYEEYIYG